MKLAMVEKMAASADESHAEIVMRLSSFLDEASDPERCLVAQALGHIPAPTSTALLLLLLRDYDPDVRIDAARSLVRTGDTQAVSLLIENLSEDPVGEAKVEYIKTLQALDAVQAIPLLLELISGRGEAAGIAWEDEVSDWDDWLDVQLAALQALTTLPAPNNDSKAVSAIIASLMDPDGQDLWAVAAGALANLGDQGCTALGNLLDDASPLNRKRIAAALGESRSGEVQDLLQGLLQDKSAAVRIAAIQSAVALGQEEMATTGLEDLLPEVRAQTLAALPSVSPAQLLRGLNDANDDVRIAACQIIAEAGQVRAGLALTDRAERHLRTGSDKTLAALVDAMVVAEPAHAAGFVSDVVNHRATKPLVRRACIRALVRLAPVGAVTLLTSTARDDRQDVRLEAVAGLGRIAGGVTAEAGIAAGVLCSAISGQLVDVPPDYQPETNNVVEFVQKRGSQAAGEESDKRLKLDRDGNIIEPEKVELNEPVEQPATIAPTPTSTLDAILAVTPPDDAGKRRIELEPEDMAFLELTSSRTVKRKLDPDKSAPAHIDVRRLAARVAGVSGNREFVTALADACMSRDDELAEACLSALIALAHAGVDIANAEASLLVHANANNLRRRACAIEALGNVPGEAAAIAIAGALGEAPEPVRARAVAAAGLRTDVSLDLAALVCDDHRAVRLAAARVVASRNGVAGVPDLMHLALAEDAVHLEQAAELLAPYRPHALEGPLSWLEGSNRKNRLSALKLIKSLLGQSTL